MALPEGRIYEHRLHAGNVGDVLKHIGLVGWLGARRGPAVYIDTHAGAGSYSLASTGEWTEGLGRILEGPAGRPPMVEAWAKVVEPAFKSARRCLGSPEIAARVLETGDSLLTSELVPEVAEQLRTSLGSRATVRTGDGLAALIPDLEAHAGRQRFVLCDPPFADKREWQTVPRALIEAYRRFPEAHYCLWYPVKSWARPNAMLNELAKSDVPAVTLELLSTPLTSKKNRLNGSGLVFLNPPPGLIEPLSATLSWLGPRLATHAGWWSSRAIGWDVGHRPGQEL
ncbi:MAG: 23S rRNA (adenine(2030)-N(6))-methyltransferase RlmJ [Myxococcota bacterium]